MSDEPEERLRKLAEHHSNIAKLLTCPICLDLLISPTRTKCGHVFCQACLEGHIKKGKKGKASCPLCNTQGLTKRALESDAAMTSLVTTFRKLLQSEKNDTGEAIDFMAIRVQRKDARESAATPPRKLPVLENLQTDSLIHCSFSDGGDGDTPESFGDILDTIGNGSTATDDTQDKVSVKQNKKFTLKKTPAICEKPSPLSTTPTISTTPSLESSLASDPVRSVKPSTSSLLWNKKKTKGPKTYSKPSTVHSSTSRGASGNQDHSQILPGEEIEGDKEWEENRKYRNLPILEGLDREEKVEEWLKTGEEGFGTPESGRYVDFSSQPSLSQGTESTPSIVKVPRPSPHLSPLDGLALRGENTKFFKSKGGSLREEKDGALLISSKVLGTGADDDLYKFQASQATPPRGKGRGRGRGKKGSKEAESLPVLEEKYKRGRGGKGARGRGKQLSGGENDPEEKKKGQKRSRDMYEHQNDLWTDLTKTTAENEAIIQDDGKKRKRNSKDMYEHQDDLWGNLMNQKEAASKINEPLDEVRSKSPNVSQMIPNSCPVVMDDTFDRVAAGAVSKQPVKEDNTLLEDNDEDDTGGLFQSPPDLLASEEAVKAVNKKKGTKKKESLEEFLNRGDKEPPPMESKKRVSWKDENNLVKTAMKADILTLEKEAKGKKLSRGKKSPGWGKVNLALGEMNQAKKQGRYHELDMTAGTVQETSEEENMDIDSVNSVELVPPPILENKEMNVKTAEDNQDCALTDSVPSVISDSQASKEDLSSKRRAFPPKKVELLKNVLKEISCGQSSPTSPMAGWSSKDIVEASSRREGVAKLVSMEEKDLAGQEAEVAKLYSSTSASNQTSQGTASNQTSQATATPNNQTKQGNASNQNREAIKDASNPSTQNANDVKEGRFTFSLDAQSIDLDEMSKPMDTLELVSEASTDSPIKCKTPTPVRRSGRQRVSGTPTAPKSVLESPSPGKTPQQQRTRRIAPMVGFGSPTAVRSAPTVTPTVGLGSPTSAGSVPRRSLTAPKSNASNGKDLKQKSPTPSQETEPYPSSQGSNVQDSNQQSSIPSQETVLSSSTQGEKSKPFDALDPEASQSCDTEMSLGFTLSSRGEAKAAKTSEQNSPNISQNIQKIEKLRLKTSTKSKKPKISFKLLGKVRTKSPVKPRRDENVNLKQKQKVNFFQSGRLVPLAERRVGPSLREIVARAAYGNSSIGSVQGANREQDQSTPAGSHKVRNWLQNLETPTSLLSGPRLAVEETPARSERVLVLETPTPAAAALRMVMETPTPADHRMAPVETPTTVDFRMSAVETPSTVILRKVAPIEVETLHKVPQMASIEIQTTQSLYCSKKSQPTDTVDADKEIENEEDAVDVDQENDADEDTVEENDVKEDTVEDNYAANTSKETASIVESLSSNVKGSKAKLKRKKAKAKKDPYENPTPGTSGLSSARITRGKSSKSNVSSSRIVEVARSRLESDSDSNVAPLAKRRSSGSSGKLSVKSIMSRLVPGDSDDMRIDNIDTADSVEEDEEATPGMETDPLKASTVCSSATASKHQEAIHDVEQDFPELSQDDDKSISNTPNLANALGVEEDDLVDALDMDELPDIDVAPGSHSGFMAGILGETEPEVYSQDRETVSQQVERVAKSQFEEDQKGAPSRRQEPVQVGKRKRSRKLSNGSQDEPMSGKRRKKVNRIESDDEDAIVVSDSSPVKQIAKVDSLRKSIGGGKFENSFKNLDQFHEDQEIETVPSQPLTQTGYSAEQMNVPDLDDQETSSMVDKQVDQENEMIFVPVLNEKPVSSVRTVLGEVKNNSPARGTVDINSQTKGIKKGMMPGIGSLANSSQKREDESQMTVTGRSSSASSLAMSTDSEGDGRTTQEIQRDVDATEIQIVKMKQQMVNGSEVLASANLANDIKENTIMVHQGEEMETLGSISLLEKEPDLVEPEEGDDLQERQESVEVGETEDEESNKMPDGDDDLFNSQKSEFSQTPEKSIPNRSKGKKPAGQLDTVVEIQEEQTSQVISRKPDTSNWKFVTTNLQPQARTMVSRWIGSLDCKGVGSKIDDEITHVIVSTGTEMQSQRTLKYLQAVASGKLVVSQLWVEAAVKAGSIPDTRDFEVKDEENGGANGPWRSRVAREAGNPGILRNYEVLVSEELEGLSKDAVEDLLVRAGARCVPDQNAFSFSPQVTGIIIADSTASMDAKMVTRQLRNYRLATVEKDWLLDSLGDWAPRPLLPYMIEQVTQEDLICAGYKGALTAVDEI